MLFSMKLNRQKKVMRVPKPIDIRIKETKIEQMEQIKYLVVKIHSKGVMNSIRSVISMHHIINSGFISKREITDRQRW